MPNVLISGTIAYLCGVVLGDSSSLREPLTSHLALAASLLFILALSFYRRWAVVGCLLTLAVCLGLSAQAHRPLPFDETSLPAAYRTALIQLQGNGAQLESPSDTPWVCEGRVVSSLLSTQIGLTFQIAVDRFGPFAGLTSGNETAAAPRRAPLLQLEPPLFVAVSLVDADWGRAPEALLPGNRLRLLCSLHAPRGHHNFGSPQIERHFDRLGISALATVRSEAIYQVEDRAEKWRWQELELRFLRHLTKLRWQLLSRLRQRLIDQPDRVGLLAALLLGERGDLLRADVKRSKAGRVPIETMFRVAGIFHVLSVSGLHLAVVSWAFFRGLARLLLWLPGLAERFVPRRIAAICAIPATLYYAALTGGELPTLRAAIAAVLWLLAVACGRRARLAESLAVAMLCIAHPSASDAPSLALYEPSLQLSLIATCAIAYLRPLHTLMNRWGRRANEGRPSAMAGALRLLGRMIDASLAATLATLPLCVYYFGEAQPAGLLGNLVAVPIGELLVLPCGLFGLLLDAISPTIGGPVIDLASLATAGMVRAAEAVAALKLSFTMPAPALWQLALWGIGLALWAMRHLLAALFCGVAIFAYLCTGFWPTANLRVTFLDVGQGDATIIELPGHKVIVVDAGPGPTTNGGGHSMGDAVVAPFLRRRGYQRIELLIASHRHPDHIGGFAALLEQFQIGTLWENPGFSPAAGRTVREEAALAAAWQQLIEIANRRGIAVETPHNLSINGATLEVLSALTEATNENDRSLVLKLRYGGRTVLLPGDLELLGELALLDRAAAIDVKADILKAPHHCSRTSSSESLVNTVSPSWVVCSVGFHNRFRFPHIEVIKRYEAVHSQVLRTDEHGSIQFTISANSKLTVEHFPLASGSNQR